MFDLEQLIAAGAAEARREDFPLDEAVYEAAGRDPRVPILCAGDLAAPVAFFARDLGKDEVAAGEPLYGAAGKLVRGGVHRALTGALEGGAEPPDRAALDAAAARVLLTNTVPFKPPGNKAYTQQVKARFRPVVAALLGGLWAGRRVLTLGNQAFEWWKPYELEKGALKAFWADEDRRYAGSIEVRLAGEFDGVAFDRTVELAPLPHPSPLNQRWYKAFPELLDRRLAAAGLQ